MATGSGAFSPKCGFNQSAGASYIVITQAVTGQVFDFPVTSGSGGAFTTAVPLIAAASLGNVVTALAPGAIIRDMGRTVIVPNATNGARTFRKFQLVGNASGDAANFGVSATTAGRAFFLETMREGQEPAGGVAPLAIARYF
jgi:hypothetical protein